MTYLITYALNLFDLAMTYYWYNQYGIAIEGNPIGRWLLETNLAIPWKIVGVGVCLYTLYRYGKKWIGWVLLAVYSALAVYHLLIYYKGGFV